MAKKIENDDLIDDSVTPNASGSGKKTDDISGAAAAEGGKGKPEKRKVVVINVPKKKKRLRTPSHIIRITLIWLLAIELFLLTYPFLQVRFYITEDLGVTPYQEKAYSKLATQEEIDNAAAELQKAIDSLVEAPPEGSDAEGSSDESKAESAASEASVNEPAESSAAEAGSSNVRELSTVDYNWSYYIRSDVDAEKLTKLIVDVKQINRMIYTEESVDALNLAVLKAQKVLCASVFISQNGFQMMLGGSVGEAFGSSISIGNTILRAFLTFALSILPLIGLFACVFDKKRIIKNIIVLICSILVLVDIFFTIYPFIGIGAVLSIILYIIISVINIGGFYARQQEKYIVMHPELEAEYTQKHPHFVKALINHKSFGDEVPVDYKAKERAAAKNAKKHNTKKKKRSR